MQRSINNNIHLVEMVNLFESIGNSNSIDKTASDFKNADEKVGKFKRLIKKGEYDEDVLRYIPGILKLAFQGIIEIIIMKEAPLHPSYSDMQNLDFYLVLSTSYYSNLNSFHLCLPIKILKDSNVAAATDDEIMIVNNFFC